MHSTLTERKEKLKYDVKEIFRDRCKKHWYRVYEWVIDAGVLPVFVPFNKDRTKLYEVFEVRGTKLTLYRRPIGENIQNKLKSE